MPTIPLPTNASLEHLKSQAKLVRDLIRTGDEGAMAMVDEFHPRLNSAGLDQDSLPGFKLADAQLIIARMYRCASWAKLRSHVAVTQELSFTPVAERADYVDFEESFVELACLNYAASGPNPHDRIKRAHQMLGADPALGTGSIDALATVGDHRAVGNWISDSPASIDNKCGPNAWTPLLYATYSRIESDNQSWSAVETVRVLLAGGADPNAGFLWQGLVPPFTALTGAFGNGESGQPWRPERLEIARLLLEAGADPNDGQTLYNNGIGGTNHDDPSHLGLLLEFGLGIQQNGPWYQRLGDQLRDPAELLYDELEAAAKRGRPNHIRLLISLGLDLERPVGRSQKTPVRLAAESGNRDVLQMLSEAGIDTALSPDEEFLDAIRTTDLVRLGSVLADNPGLTESLSTAHAGAIKGVPASGAAMLTQLIELGLDINARTGGGGTTALHEAAQADDVALARLLIEHGADPDLPDHHIGATPWGWANHFNNEATAAYLYPLTKHEHEGVDEHEDEGEAQA